MIYYALKMQLNKILFSLYLSTFNKKIIITGFFSEIHFSVYIKNKYIVYNIMLHT